MTPHSKGQSRLLWGPGLLYNWHDACSGYQGGPLPWTECCLENPVFLPGESQGQRSLVGCCLWGCGQGPHLAKRWEPRGFSRVAAAFSTSDGDLSLPLGLALGSPIFPSVTSLAPHERLPEILVVPRDFPGPTQGEG